MRKFAESYPDLNCATAVAQIPWGHNLVILEKIENNDQRLWYVEKMPREWMEKLLSLDQI